MISLEPCMAGTVGSLCHEDIKGFFLSSPHLLQKVFMPVMCNAFENNNLVWENKE